MIIDVHVSTSWSKGHKITVLLGDRINGVVMIELSLKLILGIHNNSYTVVIILLCTWCNDLKRCSYDGHQHH